MQATTQLYRHVSKILWIASIVLIGSMVAYVMTPFVTQAMPNGVVVHPICCFAYSLQLLCWVGVWRWSKGRHHWFRVVALVLVAVVAEFAEARLVTPVWIMTHPVLFLVNTPIVQWVDWLSTLGLSALLYLACFSALPQMDVVGWKRWQGSLVGCAILILLWLGGQQIEARVSVENLPFSVALVQPNVRRQPEKPCEPWRELIRLTDAFVAEADGIDLIVWPENALTATVRSRAIDRITQCSLDESTGQANPTAEKELTQFDVGAMVARFRNQSGASLLAGSVLVDQVQTVKFGLMMPQLQRMNCACLWNRGGGSACGQLQIYEKRVLMPLREYVPSWLRFELVRNWLLPQLTSNELTPGVACPVLLLTDSQAIEYRLAVAICYESWLPWLPQYHTREPVDAICHLIFDGDFADYPVYTERMLAAIRLRAIETRTWQLVCSSWAGSAVIDPRGRIIKQLPPKPGVLRTDQL